MADETPMKRCSKCKEWFPATPEYFHRRKKSRDGLNGVCRNCKNRHQREYSADYNMKNREKLREKHRRYARSHQPERTAYMREYRKTHQDQFLEYRRLHYAANRLHLAQQKRESASRNREKVRESNRRSWHKHAEKRHAAQRQFARENRLKIANRRHQRRARERNLPYSYSVEDWQLALDHFGACAYCGNVSNVYHADHFIPIAAPACPGTVATNIVPACPTCNYSKNKADAALWLAQTFGADRAAEILKRIFTYFASLAE